MGYRTNDNLFQNETTNCTSHKSNFKKQTQNRAWPLQIEEFDVYLC